MNRFYVFLAAILLSIALIFAGCSKDENDEKTEKEPTATEAAEDNQSENNTDEEKLLIAPAEDPQIAADNTQALEYLSILGLDETAAYELRDTFPTGNGDDKSYLLNITGISEDDFAAVQQSLQNMGFGIVSDIMEDTERQTKSFQYSNENNLYIEIVYSYGAEYFDVIFTPIS